MRPREGPCETEAFLAMFSVVDLERKGEVEHDCTALCSELLVQPWEVLLIRLKKQTNQTKTITATKPQQKKNSTAALPQARSKSKGQSYVKAHAENRDEIEGWTLFSSVWERPVIRYKDCGIAAELSSPRVLRGMQVACCSGGLWLDTSVQTSCSRSCSEENRCLAMEQISKTV